jgi:DNA-binding transcriptional LysR family regulator
VRLDFRGGGAGRADPSAVSRTLSRLEAKLDTTLINRTTRRMDLTEEGKYFFERSKLILAQMDELEEHLSSRQQKPAGRLRINAAVPFMLHGIVPYIAEFAGSTRISSWS